MIKKLVSMFVHLIPGAIFLLMILLFAQRWWPRTCRYLALSVCVALLAGSTAPVSNYFVTPLEAHFPVLESAPQDTALVLVLGLGHMYEPDRPPNSVLMAAALARLAEGVRVWKTQPDAYLALSGAKFRSTISHARAMQAMAMEWGVPQERIVLFEHTRDTQAEINAAVKELDRIRRKSDVSRDRLVVASSATHLPRAARMLDLTAVSYSMAPTDFLTIDAPWYRPDAGFLRNLDRAIHEYVGMAWFRIRQVAS